jgi:membrane protease subunit HflC
MKDAGKLIGLIIVAALAITAFSSVYVVDETEQVVVTMFGKAIGEPVTSPGLKIRAPFVHKVNFFPKNILEWDGQKGQIPTKDKTFIWVDIFGRWRIVDPLRFFEKLRTENSAQRTLDGIIDAAVRNLVTSHNLIEAVRSSDRDLPREDWDADDSLVAGEQDTAGFALRLGRARMREEIMKQAGPKLREFGIELVDVRFKRINYVEEVLRKVYDRMIAERRQIAEKYRSEGRGESQKILGKKERELKRIFSEAYRQGEEIKGLADQQAAAIYAAAYRRDPEFYSFTRTLEMYKQSLDSTTWAVFSTKADFLRYLKRYTPAR